MSNLTAAFKGVHLAGIDFPSVILNASGCFNASFFSELHPLNTALGGIVTKTVKNTPVPGNAQQRTVELPGIGMLNSIGLQGPGLEYCLEQDIPDYAKHELPIILSISATSFDEFAEMASKIKNHANANLVSAIEVNLSCPNVEEGGVHFGISPEGIKGAVAAVKNVCPQPVFAKLTPNVTSMLPLAEAAIDGGANALVAINTVMGAAIDIKNRKPHIPRVTAGYSGPGIKPIAIRAIWELHEAFPETPVIGIGGISNANDVLEFLMAGASMVQVGTSCFRDPMVFQSIVSDLETWCLDNNVEKLTELTGAAHQNS